MSDDEPSAIPAKQNQGPGCALYAIGGSSFIPLLGVPLGITAIIWGLVEYKQGGWKAAILGALGISFTVILYGSLFYFGFVKRGGIFDELRSNLNEQMLVSLVKEIEFYKIQNGDYPQKLEDLQSKSNHQGFVLIYDQSHVNFSDLEPRLFHYKLVNNSANYHLLSVGADGKPYTSDDKHPALDKTKMKSIGYILPDNKGLEKIEYKGTDPLL